MFTNYQMSNRFNMENRTHKFTHYEYWTDSSFCFTYSLLRSIFFFDVNSWSSIFGVCLSHGLLPFKSEYSIWEILLWVGIEFLDIYQVSRSIRWNERLKAKPLIITKSIFKSISSLWVTSLFFLFFFLSWNDFIAQFYDHLALCLCVWLVRSQKWRKCSKWIHFCCLDSFWCGLSL